MSDFENKRREMVERQLIPRNINDAATLESMLSVPRHLFVPSNMIPYAYEDSPLQIGSSQTISQPYIVALMTQSAELQPESKVLEIGTGSGYAAAVLSLVCKNVYTVERIPELYKRSVEVLQELGYDNVEVKLDDGTLGWAEKGPFDAIIVTAAAPNFPQALIDQLKAGGRLVIPVGDSANQELFRLIRQQDRTFKKETLGAVRFVPLIGEQGW